MLPLNESTTTRARLGPAHQRGTLLLGNGASIAVSPTFGYGSLLSHARGAGTLKEDVQRLFDFFGTSDFELVLRIVWQTSNVNRSLQIPTNGPIKRILTSENA